MPRAFTFFRSLILFDQVDFTLGRKENVTSLKYLLSKSGHTFRMFTTSSATSSSSAAVFKPNRKCRSVRFPPLSERQREGSAGNCHNTLRAQGNKRITLSKHSCKHRRLANFILGKFPRWHETRCFSGLWGSSSPSKGFNFTLLLLSG